MKKSTLSVAIDLSEVFDSVNHDVLIDDLWYKGILFSTSKQSYASSLPPL